MGKRPSEQIVTVFLFSPLPPRNHSPPSSFSEEKFTKKSRLTIHTPRSPKSPALLVICGAKLMKLPKTASKNYTRGTNSSTQRRKKIMKGSMEKSKRKRKLQNQENDSYCLYLFPLFFTLR